MKIMILANNDAGLYKFRQELLEEHGGNHGNQAHAHNGAADAAPSGDHQNHHTQSQQHQRSGAELAHVNNPLCPLRCRLQDPPDPAFRRE